MGGAGSANSGNFLEVVTVSAVSEQGGAVTYSSDTPTTCTVDANTGAVTINGGGAGDCTVRATSSQGGSNTRTISINTVTLDTVQCAPDAPRAGDSFDESFKARNSAYQAPRPYAVPGNAGITYAFDNPKIRQLKDVQATFAYSDAGGGLVNLQTTALTNSCTAANPAVPSGAWDGWVPLPVQGDTYSFNADGSINNAPRRPAAASKVSKTSAELPVQEFLPVSYNGKTMDWQQAFAAMRDTNNTSAGDTVGNLTVTMRETGGFLNRWNHKQSVDGVLGASNWGYTGATYLEAYYQVTAKFEGLVDMPSAEPSQGWKAGAVSSSNPKQDSAAEAVVGAHGKVQYGKMCKFSYRFTRVGDAQTQTQANTSDGAVWNGLASAKTDANSTCALAGCSNWSLAGSSYGHGASNQEKIANTIGDSYGDWAGTFYTHDKLPRVVKDFRSAIGRMAGGTPWYPTSGVIQMPMANWAYFDQHDGNDAPNDTPSGTTPPTQVDSLMTQANRLVFP